MVYSYQKDEHLQDKNYQIYLKRKNKLKEKYPNWNEGGTDECRKYMAEVCQLFSTDKNFQKFVWDNISTGEAKKRESIINPRKQGQRYATVRYF
jgi:hypothetical protein